LDINVTRLANNVTGLAIVTLWPDWPSVRAGVSAWRCWPLRAVPPSLWGRRTSPEPRPGNGLVGEAPTHRGTVIGTGTRSHRLVNASEPRRSTETQRVRWAGTVGLGGAVFRGGVGRVVQPRSFRAVPVPDSQSSG